METRIQILTETETTLGVIRVTVIDGDLVATAAWMGHYTAQNVDEMEARLAALGVPGGAFIAGLRSAI